MIRENKGITLIALTITIIVLIILASVATYSGISTIKSSKLNKFKQELEIMQSEVQVLYEKYKDEETIDVGKEISGSGKEEQAEIAFDGAEETNTSGYRLFDAEEIEKLGIEGIEREYLLDIMNRKVISLEPFEQDGKAYYTLNQMPGTDKNTIDEGVVRDSVNFSVSTTEASSGWEITVSNIEYSKYVGKGKILYQKVGNDNWTTVVDDFKGEEYTFAVNSEGQYNIKIIDAAGVESEVYYVECVEPIKPEAIVDLLETSSPASSSGRYDIGENLTCEIKISNVGNVELKNIKITPLITRADGSIIIPGDLDDEDLQISEIGVGEFYKLDFSHTISQTDVLGGDFILSLVVDCTTEDGMNLTYKSTELLIEITLPQ